MWTLENDDVNIILDYENYAATAADDNDINDICTYQQLMCKEDDSLMV